MSYKYFENKECEYFPCHKGANSDNFNCLFCYCPLYALGEECGGNTTYLENGVKDCSNCTFPHNKDNYNRIMEKLGKVVEITKKQ